MTTTKSLDEILAEIDEIAKESVTLPKAASRDISLIRLQALAIDRLILALRECRKQRNDVLSNFSYRLRERIDDQELAKILTGTEEA